MPSPTPEDHEKLRTLVATLRDERRLDESVIAASQALKVNPRDHETLNNLGITLLYRGNLAAAEAVFLKATLISPKFPEALNNLGALLRTQGRLEEARNHIKKALKISQNFVDAHNNLGNVLKDQGELIAAEESYRRCLKISPDHLLSLNNLANLLIIKGEIKRAKYTYRRALKIDPNSLPIRSNLLFLQSAFEEHSNSYLKGAKEFGRVLANLTPIPSVGCFAQESLKIRVGLVSGDLKSHPVGYFLINLLKNVDSLRIEFYVYSTNPKQDLLTEKIKKHVNKWQSVIGQTDESAAQLISGDNVQILIDLAGHTGENRLGIFAYRAAPIQIAWLGYFASTGVRTIDYILGDPYVTPLIEQKNFTEKIWQLPETYLCFSPPDESVSVGRLPALENKTITFGCFNKIERINDNVVKVWSRILLALPASRLFLKSANLLDLAVRNKILGKFAANGVAKERIYLEGSSPRSEYLAAYNRIDIALSPFPYGGGTTSAEGLWMGVPVITKKGNSFVSHLGESIAHNTGLSDWIAADEDEYVAKAISFASDFKSLAELRSSLRAQVLSSPLFDAKRFSNNFETALREMWDEKSNDIDIERGGK